MSERGNQIGGAFLAAGVLGGLAALGASIAKRPSVGAAVGVGVPVALFTGASLVFVGAEPVPGLLMAGAHTGLIAGGAALGAAAGGRHPSVGAFVGAASALGLEIVALKTMNPPATTEKQVGASGPPGLLGAILAPRVGLHLRAVGGFP